jgi:hypothetical protein
VRPDNPRKEGCYRAELLGRPRFGVGVGAPALRLDRDGRVVALEIGVGLLARVDVLLDRAVAADVEVRVRRTGTVEHVVDRVGLGHGHMEIDPVDDGEGLATFVDRDRALDCGGG